MLPCIFESQASFAFDAGIVDREGRYTYQGNTDSRSFLKQDPIPSVPFCLWFEVSQVGLTLERGDDCGGLVELEQEHEGIRTAARLSFDGEIGIYNISWVYKAQTGETVVIYSFSFGGDTQPSLTG